MWGTSAGGQASEGYLDFSYPSEEDVGKNTYGGRAEGSSDSGVRSHGVRRLMGRFPRPSRIVRISWQGRVVFDCCLKGP